MATCLPHCVLLGCMYICVHASITLCVFECMCVCARVCVHSVLPGKDLQKSFLHNWRFFSSSLTYCWVRLFGSEQCLFLQGGLALTTVCVCVCLATACALKSKPAEEFVCEHVHSHMWACISIIYVSTAPPPSSRLGPPVLSVGISSRAWWWLASSPAAADTLCKTTLCCRGTVPAFQGSLSAVQQTQLSRHRPRTHQGQDSGHGRQVTYVNTHYLPLASHKHTHPANSAQVSAIPIAPQNTPVTPWKGQHIYTVTRPDLWKHRVLRSWAES